ncbi:MAG: pyridoxal phosphate-dependent aminotransferase [Candidatus Kapabacteria bacterium]|nr:pyridoxal phosphate-dependent aminotransferase [Candidatus Kapabacteria bacterium]
MLELSRRVAGASESQTLAIAARAKSMKQAGIDVISLSTGEPDFPTPQCAKQAAIDALNENFTHYTESNGIPELRRAVAEKFRNENGIVTADESTVLISCGAKHSIMNILGAMCNPGDEVIIPAPYWVSYPAMVALTGATPVIVPATPEHRFLMQPAALAAALTPRTKCVILNSPSNPTGMMYSESELRALAAVLEQHDCYVISDEIYEKIHYGVVPHFSIGSIRDIADRVITVNGCSKAYAMTGWRIGFANAPKNVFAQAAKIQSQDTSNPTSIAQRAALAALRFAADDVEAMRRVFARRREMVCELVGAIGGIRILQPDGAFYIWMDVRDVLGGTVPDSATLCSKLLEEHHLALVPGEAFGASGYLRASFAAAESDITYGMARLAACIASL